MTRRHLMVLGILAVSMVLAGCVRPPEQSEYVALVRPQADETIMTAEIEGNLALVNDRCFGIEAEEGLFVAVFPSGTIADSESVTIPGIGRIEIGEHLSTGGGFIPPDRAGVDIPAKCTTKEVIVVTPR